MNCSWPVFTGRGLYSLMSTPRYKIAFDRDGVNGKQRSEIAYKRMSLFIYFSEIYSGFTPSAGLISIGGPRGSFLERPGNFSGSKANFKIKTC